jgi:hypothetical protein
VHSTLRPGGFLAVFRTIFGDDTFDTEFRHRIGQIVARREPRAVESAPEWRPTMAELSADGSFEPMRSEHWRWSVELSTDQVTRLFRTFSDWTEEEVHAVRRAVDACGGRVTEHYQSALNLLSRA